MFKSFIVAAALVVTSAAQATESIASVIFKSQASQIQEVIRTQGLNWQVGDTNNYKLNMAGFINGTMKMYVREISADGIWMNQDVDLMGQKQVVEILIDPNTGEIKKMIVNGKEEQIPDSNPEIVDQKEATVTVPAGTFKAIYLKLKEDNKFSEAWLNPRDLPLSGMIKSIADSQLGKVTIELTSFTKK